MVFGELDRLTEENERYKTAHTLNMEMILERDRMLLEAIAERDAARKQLEGKLS